jgi:hypothetical protein
VAQVVTSIKLKPTDHPKAPSLFSNKGHVVHDVVVSEIVMGPRKKPVNILFASTFIFLVTFTINRAREDTDRGH